MEIFIFILYILILLTVTVWALKDSARYADGTDNPDWYRCMLFHFMTIVIILIGTTVTHDYLFKGW